MESAGTEIPGYLQVVFGNVGHGGINGQECQRNQQSHQRDDHGPVAEDEKSKRLVDEVHLQQDRVENAILSEDGAPGIDAHQVPAEHGSQDQIQQQLRPMRKDEPPEIRIQVRRRDHQTSRDKTDQDGSKEYGTIEAGCHALQVIQESEARRQVKAAHAPETESEENQNGRQEKRNIERRGRSYQA